MRTLDVNGATNTNASGKELYDLCVRKSGRQVKTCYAYDYWHTDGTSFSCVKPTLEECRAARDEWLECLIPKTLTNRTISAEEVELLTTLATGQAQSFISDCESRIKDTGVPFTIVAEKTGISYNRLRNIRSRAVEPTLSEFIALGTYCKLDLSKYIPVTK